MVDNIVIHHHHIRYLRLDDIQAIHYMRRKSVVDDNPRKSQLRSPLTSPSRALLFSDLGQRKDRRKGADTLKDGLFGFILARTNGDTPHFD